jgi:hypothetical protein
MKQADLLDTDDGFPMGFYYEPEFLSVQQEKDLLEAIGLLPLQEAVYRDWKAKRRIVSYGGRYDFTHRELGEAPPIPQFLHPLREQIARWAGVMPALIHHAVIAEYRPGTQLGWHRDVPNFEPWASRLAGAPGCVCGRIRRNAERALPWRSSSSPVPPIPSPARPGGPGSTLFRPRRNCAIRSLSGPCAAARPALDARAGRLV